LYSFFKNNYLLSAHLCSLIVDEGVSIRISDSSAQVLY